MLEQKSGRKLIIKRINSEFIEELSSSNYLNKKTEGFLLGVSLALKNVLDYQPIDVQRNAQANGRDVVIEDEKSMNQIDDLKVLVKAIYPEKYNESKNIEYMNKLLSVLADAGLDYLRNECYQDESVNHDKFVSLTS